MVVGTVSGQMGILRAAFSRPRVCRVAAYSRQSIRTLDSIATDFPCSNADFLKFFEDVLNSYLFLPFIRIIIHFQTLFDDPCKC